MNNLALVLSGQGEHAQAEGMHRQVLGLRETSAGQGASRHSGEYG